MHGQLICIIHIGGVSRCLISASLCPISLFSFKFELIIHICPAFYRKVNTNASKSLQMSYNHYKSFANITIRMACDWLKYVAKSYKYAFLANLRSMFLIFPKIECKCLGKHMNAMAITLGSL